MLSQRPLGFLGSRWPWRALLYLLGSLPNGIVVIAAVAVSALVPGGLPYSIVLGVGVIVAAAPVVVGYERWRVRLVDREELGRAGFGRNLGLAVITTAAFWWIDLVMLGVAVGGPVVLVLSPVVQPPSEVGVMVGAVVAGVLLVPVSAYVVTGWAGARASIVRAVLAPGGPELEEVLRSRKRLVDAFEVERRRIERDLHDGAQQRLVALSMTLGLARLDVDEGSDVGLVLERAHLETKAVLGELRELIRGVHSQVLTDRGLLAAVNEMAGRSAIPVEVVDGVRGRLPAAVEVVGYYVVSEVLANAAKHSGASEIEVKVDISGAHPMPAAPSTLTIEVIDNGTGGATPTAGTGLTGLADRLDVLGGTLTLSSPPGGPTLIRAEIPCD